jgi:hypothetical protein
VRQQKTNSFLYTFFILFFLHSNILHLTFLRVMRSITHIVSERDILAFFPVRCECVCWCAGVSLEIPFEMNRIIFFLSFLTYNTIEHINFRSFFLMLTSVQVHWNLSLCAFCCLSCDIYFIFFFIFLWKFIIFSPSGEHLCTISCSYLQINLKSEPAYRG